MNAIMFEKLGDWKEGWFVGRSAVISERAIDTGRPCMMLVRLNNIQYPYSMLKVDNRIDLPLQCVYCPKQTISELNGSTITFRFRAFSMHSILNCHFQGQAKVSIRETTGRDW